jgi:hypothetical protein
MSRVIFTATRQYSASIPPISSPPGCIFLFNDAGYSQLPETSDLWSADALTAEIDPNIILLGLTDKYSAYYLQSIYDRTMPLWRKKTFIVAKAIDFLSQGPNQYTLIYEGGRH